MDHRLTGMKSFVLKLTRTEFGKYHVKSIWATIKAKTTINTGLPFKRIHARPCLLTMDSHMATLPPCPLTLSLPRPRLTPPLPISSHPPLPPRHIASLQCCPPVCRGVRAPSYVDKESQGPHLVHSSPQVPHVFTPGCPVLHR